MYMVPLGLIYNREVEVEKFPYMSYGLLTLSWC